MKHPQNVRIEITHIAPDGNTYGKVIDSTFDDPYLTAMFERVVRYAKYQFRQGPRPEFMPSFAHDSKIPLGKLDDQ